MQPYHGVQQLPSPREIARALGGHVRKDGAIAFPGPGRKSTDRSCTLALRPEAPDGFIVADARKQIPGLVLKDYARERFGVPFQADSKLNVRGKAHRSASGPAVREVAANAGA